ncbi:MAG: type I methionyl aminopeptidase [Peptoniphilaceae bacterium]|uniref:type I methionyl aminopeptidase n=1 Tax=Parvimonas sp. TaxID=1944660 RepID=UPI0025F368E8|nr:type I methionyl aminopeptidase [Parvimonas sp.]MCI5996963.1 type I methionyl aminopeptidase [Parvimonas sp.]MDD7765049.1 type I methionyl aminopeptidase [Peptoniphilaceae bacterium]MDY3050267.1 type I methionyl aminopeptidase [Parvimonas sp.]
MITIKSKKEIDGMRKSAEILSKIHINLRDIIVPGITTMEINKFCHEFMLKHGATPKQIGYHGYPYATCTSVNDVICHGFPKNQKLKEGDLITVDMVVDLNGYLSDSAWSYAVGEVSQEVKNLMNITKEALYRGINAAVVGNRIVDIGYAIQNFVEPKGYSIVRDFCGHGIGKEMHEDPQVPHYITSNRGVRLEEGMVITVEPMINVGDWRCTIDDDGWTARTIDGSLSCQYEHTLVITKNGPEILTEQSLYE